MNPLDIKPRFFYNSIRISALEVFLFFKEKYNIELTEEQIDSVGWEIENNIERYFEPKDILEVLSDKLFGRREEQMNETATKTSTD